MWISRSEQDSGKLWSPERVLEVFFLLQKI